MGVLSPPNPYRAYAQARGDDPAELAATILRGWLRDQQGAHALRRESGDRGIQWKNLFQVSFTAQTSTSTRPSGKATARITSS